MFHEIKDSVVARPMVENLNFSVVQTFYTRNARRYKQTFNLRALASAHVK